MYLAKSYGREKELRESIHKVYVRYSAGNPCVTGSEVAELFWTGGMGIGSVVSLLNATYIN